MFLFDLAIELIDRVNEGKGGSAKDRFDQAYEATQHRSEPVTILMSWPDCGPKD